MARPRITKRAVPAVRIRESAQQIWLAGLGAFALANQEGGKLFHSLVKKGYTVQKGNTALVAKMRLQVAKIRATAGRALVRVTRPFPGGMTTALKGFGIPSRKEIVALTKRVDELRKSVERTRVKAHKPTAAATH